MKGLLPDVLPGQTRPAHFKQAPSGSLLVNEIFYSVQGEGRYKGAPAVFFRLAKCNLACLFCDTEFDRGEVMDVQTAADRVMTSVEETVGRELSREEWANVVVVFTGGEPSLQDLVPLAKVLSTVGMTLTIETNGTLPLPIPLCELLDSVTVSPKAKVIRSFQNIPYELHHLMFPAWDVKWVMGRDSARFIEDLRGKYHRDPDVQFIMAEDDFHLRRFKRVTAKSDENLHRAYEFVRRNPWATLCVRDHKVGGWK